MRTLLNAILRYHFFILFVLLEVISLSIVISADIEKKNVFFSSANIVSGFFNEKIKSLESYFVLNIQNKQLLEENVRLRNQIEEVKSNYSNASLSFVDTSGPYRFEYIPARVIKNTVSRNKNFITLDRGEKDGVEKDFGVISSNGVVGIVVATSKRYSLVVSILNTDIGISGKIKKNNYFGSVQWQAGDYRYASMYEIPNHLKISIGDTIITSGYSAVFPEGLDIGLISKVEKNVSNNFFNLEIELLTDYKNLYNVYIVNNKNRREQILLENTVKDEY